MHLHGKPWRVTTRGTHTVPSSGNEARISFTVNGFQRHGKTSCEFWDTKESNRARIVGQIELGTKREAIEVAGEAGRSEGYKSYGDSTRYNQ